MKATTQVKISEIELFMYQRYKKCCVFYQITSFTAILFNQINNNKVYTARE